MNIKQKKVNPVETSSIYRLLATQGPHLYLFSLVLGVIGGVSYALLFPIVLYSFERQELFLDGYIERADYGFFNSPTESIAMLFLVNCVVILLSKSLSVIVNNILSQNASVALRHTIYEKISTSKICSIEKVGATQLISTINLDVTNVVLGAISITTILTSVVTLIGLLWYLSYLDFSSFVFVLVVLIVGVITFNVLIVLSERFLKRSRLQFDKVNQGIEALIKGAKELKLNREHTEHHLASVLSQYEQSAKSEYIKGSSIVYLANTYGELLVFLAIGISAFHLVYIYDVGQMDQISIVMTLLFLAGPVGVILNSIPQLSKGNVSLRKLNQLISELESEKLTYNGFDFGTWDVYTLENINYKYLSQGEAFSLQGITLEFPRGKITFVVGGNGSGKSTLAKILSLHYFKDSGTIKLGECEVDDTNIAAARQHVGAVFTDFYLFDHIHNFRDDKAELARRYLRILELDDKVEIDQLGRFSTIDLSDGQKKRLAMLALFLDDKDIYIFDEWAADQDPRFKKVFYEKILPDLRARQKVVIAITHDDAYFPLADRVITMDFGSVKSVVSNFIEN